MFTDNELLSYFEDLLSNSIVKDETILPYDSRRLYHILRSPHRITNCPLCGGDLKHSIKSECVGYGEFPQFVVFSCLGRCKFRFRSCISYGASYDDACADYLTQCRSIISSIKGD